jgi:hypothetical protein
MLGARNGLYKSLLFGSFIAPSLNGADSAGWFMNNPG